MAAFYSQPSDAELVEVYLRHRVDTGETPSPLFHTADVYSVHPDELTREYRPLTSRDGVSSWYFFTTLRSKTSGGVRVKRSVTSGENWHGEHKEKPILAGRGGARIGYKKTLAFSRRENGKLVRLGWLLMEVGLADGGGGGAQWRGIVLCKIYRSPRGPAPGPNNIAGDAPRASTRSSPTAAEGSRGPNNFAFDAPPRASTRSSPTAAEGARGATVSASPRTAEAPRGASESAVPGAGRTAEGQRSGSASVLAGGARAAEGPPGSFEREVASRTGEEHRGGSVAEVAGSARMEEGPRGGSVAEVAGGAPSATCSCGQDRHKVLRLDHSAARAAKAWVLAQVELDDKDASVDDPVLHKICAIKRVGAPGWLASSRKRKEMEVCPGWLLLTPASAAAVRNPSSYGISCARCCKRHSF